MPDESELTTVEGVYSFWGRFPLLYAASDYLTFLGRPHAIRRAAVDALGLAPGARVLEVACGSGRDFAYLLEAIGPHGSLVGLDYSRDMLGAAAALCLRRGWGNVRLARGDAAALELGERDFDGVLCVLGMSAIPGWERALQRCRAALRPGGRLSVCDARLFGGRLAFLNHAVRSAYARFAAWDPERDIPHAMEAIFGNVRVTDFNAGTFFVAVSAREAG